MSTPTVNRFELTDAQRREFQCFIERNCQRVFDDLADSVHATSREFAESFNPNADEDSIEVITDELLELVDIRCVVKGIYD